MVVKELSALTSQAKSRIDRQTCVGVVISGSLASVMVITLGPGVQDMWVGFLL